MKRIIALESNTSNTATYSAKRKGECLSWAHTVEEGGEL